MSKPKSPRRQTAAVAPAPVESIASPGPTKLDRVIALLRRREGATLLELQDVTGWQAHSVRGALAGTVKARLTTPITSTKEERGRVYRTGAGA